MNKKTWLAAMLGILAAISLRAVDPPMTINYQGVLRSAAGSSMTGTYDMTFSFFDAPTAGTLLLSDAHTAAGGLPVTASNGLFNAVLGGGTLTSGGESTMEGVFKNHAAVYLELQVGAETLAPRVRIASAAYAQNAHSLDGKESSEYALAGHTQDASTIASGTLTVARGGTGLAEPGTSGNVLTSDGTSWVSSVPAAPDLSGRVPYTGATGDVNLGYHKLRATDSSGNAWAELAYGGLNIYSQSPPQKAAGLSLTSLGFMEDGRWGVLRPPTLSSSYSWNLPSASGTLMLTTGTAGNSSLLEGHPASYFLLATGTAANSSQLEGHTASYFQVAGNYLTSESDPRLPAAGANGNLLISNGTEWVSSAPGNADTVDNLHASSSPTPGYLYPLNGNAKFPNSVLYAGTGNGLDADFLDGQHGSFYQNASNMSAGTLGVARGGTGLVSPGTSGNVLTSNGTSWVSSPPGGAGDPDEVIGNEIVAPSDNTLVRSGSGTSASPFTLGLNLNRANRWTAEQTFSVDTNLPGGIWSTSGNVGIGTTTPPIGAKLDIRTSAGEGIRCIGSNATTGITGISSQISGAPTGTDFNNYGGAFLVQGPDAGTGENAGVDAIAFSLGSGEAFGVRGMAYAHGTGNAYSIYGRRPIGVGTGLKYAGYFDGDVRVIGKLIDSSGSAGSYGQYLQSTGAYTRWASLTVTDADTVDGNHASSFALSGHTHNASAVTSGTLSDARLSSNVALLNGAQSFDGAKTFGGGISWSGTATGSITGNSDTVDTKHASDFALLSHTQDAATITSGTLAVAQGGTGMASPGASGNVLTSDGTGWVSLPPAAISDGDWTISGNDLYSAVSGNVGIGTAAPDHALTVNGDVAIGTAATSYRRLRLGGGNSFGYHFGDFPVLGDGIHMSYNYYVDGATSTEVIPNTAGATSRITAAYGRVMLATGAVNSSPVDRLVVSQGGNVGLQTEPYFPLSFADTLGDKISLWGQDTENTFGFGIQSGLLQIHTGQVSQDVAIGYGPSASFVETMRVRGNGNVGIGTTAPAYQLQLSTDSAAKPGSNTWTVPSDRRLKKDVAPFTDGLGVIEKINPVSYRYNGLGGTPNDMPGIGVVAQEIQQVAPYTVGTFKAKLDGKAENETELLDFNSHALTFVMINAIKELDERTKALTPSAHATGTPVSGHGAQASPAESDEQSATDDDGSSESGATSSAVTGSLYPVCETTQAGDVLVNDPAMPGQFCLGRTAADPGVVGIALGAPDAVARDERGALMVPVATSGIVPCKVDATFGPILANDLLVVSPNPGHAMKAVNPAPGTILGKAVEPMDAGTGTVRVLVMLR